MKISNHRLLHDNGDAYPFERSPNQSPGTITPRFLVLHYTAGRSAESSVAWFKNPDANASAHLVIGRDGSITQMVAFNRKAWHAGKSRWGDVVGLNGHSIGIELDNAGELTRKAGGGWTSWFGKTYDEADVVVANHKHDAAGTPASGWHAYTEKQLDALMDVVAVLQARYKFEAILGHDDVSPGRKRDPGPAFPMASVTARQEGRDNDADIDPINATCKVCGQPMPLDG